jgi:hypothetical protein
MPELTAPLGEGGAVIAATIAAALGHAQHEGRSWRCRCPLHGGRSLVLRDADGGRLLLTCWGGCDRLDVLAELRRRGLLGTLPRAFALQARPQATDAYVRKQANIAAALWIRRRRIAGTIAEVYLRVARGLTCPLPATLAFLPPSKPDHYPAMIATFALVDEPEPSALGDPRSVDSVHLTLLRGDGSGKADVQNPKRIVSRPLGRPIVLAPPNDLLGLAITEGIEDALTVHQATGLGAWAAGAAGFMPRLADRVPDYVEVVTIYAHADKAGQDGARKLAATCRQRGIEVVLEGL